MTKAYTGTGTIYMRPVSALGVKSDDFKPVGTAYPLSVAVTNEQIKVPGRTVETAGQTIAAKNKITEITGSLVLKEWNAQNLAYALSGSYASQVAGGASITDESITIPVPGEWIDVLHRDISTVVVTSDPAGTTYTVDVDYEFDAKLGLFTTVTGGALAAGTVATLIDYDYAAKTGYLVQIGDTVQNRVEIWANLYDEYSQIYYTIELDSVILGANQEINFISEPDAETEELQFLLTPETITGNTSPGRVGGILL